MRRTIAFAALVISVAVTGSAHAGGGPPPPPVKKYVRIAERVIAKTTVRFQRRAEAFEWMAEGPYYTYVSPGWGERPRRERPISLDAVRVGDVILQAGQKGRSVRLRAPFVAEGFSPGRYRLDVCTSPCTAEGEYVHVGRFRVVRGALERDLRKAIDEHEVRINEWGRINDELTSEVGVIRPVTRRISTHTTQMIADQNVRIDELTAALEDVRRAAADKPFPVAEAGLGFIAGALVLAAISLGKGRFSRKERVSFRRRRSSRSPVPGPPIRRALRAAPPMSAAPEPHAPRASEPKPADRRSYTPL